MFNGTFMTSIRFSWAMRDLVTLLCIGIALAPAFKMHFWNIGAEGQVLMGGLATAMVMVKCGASLPTPVLFLVMFLTSVIAGGLWGFIPAVFKAYWNTNETLVYPYDELCGNQYCCMHDQYSSWKGFQPW